MDTSNGHTIVRVRNVTIRRSDRSDRASKEGCLKAFFHNFGDLAFVRLVPDSKDACFLAFKDHFSAEAVVEGSPFEVPSVSDTPCECEFSSLEDMQLGEMGEEAPIGSLGRCCNCGQAGHTSYGCPRQGAGDRSCYICGEMGHLSYDCSNRNNLPQRGTPAARAMHSPPASKKPGFILEKRAEESKAQFEKQAVISAATSFIKRVPKISSQERSSSSRSDEISRKKEASAAESFALGKMHWKGSGVEVDKKKAVKYWYAAAVLQHPRACRDLSHAYHTGQGVRKDLERAYKWNSTAMKHLKHKKKKTLASAKEKERMAKLEKIIRQDGKAIKAKRAHSGNTDVELQIENRKPVAEVIDLADEDTSNEAFDFARRAHRKRKREETGAGKSISSFHT